MKNSRTKSELNTFRLGTLILTSNKQTHESRFGIPYLNFNSKTHFEQKKKKNLEDSRA
jgi:hypothetical protein